MCGLVAVFAKEGTVNPDKLEKATKTLHHRGPDGQHQWISASKKIGLGHTRLSIIDLTTGDQPLSNEDGTLHVVVNGEFYDFERIRTELEKSGHRFRTQSDSEIVLHLYEEYGTQCLHHLRGEFAFVLWDERNQLLFAARDRFGIKPLYYAQIGNSLCFASEIKALIALGLTPRWDQESYFDSQYMLAIPRHDRTLFEGVYQLPGGHYLMASTSQTKVMRYWDFNYIKQNTATAPLSDAEFAEALRSKFDEAVRLRLRADVPVGCYLSGGLDSCSVLGFASQHVTQPIKAFTLSFQHQEYDEKALAEEMAQKANAEFHPITMQQSDLADHFSDAIWHSEAMCINAHGVAKFLLSRAVRDAGYKVVMTGEGSDEILGGYPHFRRDMLLYNNEGQDPAVIKQLLQSLQSTNNVSSGLMLPHGESLPMHSIQKNLGYIPSWCETFSTRAASFTSLYSDSFADQYASRDPYQIFLNDLDIDGQLRQRDPVNQSLYLWSKMFLPNYILVLLGDRMEMAHSVEGRVPFLDHHVVELMTTLPVSQKINGMTEKYVMRQAAKPLITKNIYERQKHPFLAPPASLTPNDKLYQLLQDTLRGPQLASLPFYDVKKVLKLLDEIPTMDTTQRTVSDIVLTGILSACVLQERFHLS